jgi:hypothetical protein
MVKAVEEARNEHRRKRAEAALRGREREGLSRFLMRFSIPSSVKDWFQFTTGLRGLSLGHIDVGEAGWFIRQVSCVAWSCGAGSTRQYRRRGVSGAARSNVMETEDERRERREKRERGGRRIEVDM